MDAKKQMSLLNQQIKELIGIYRGAATPSDVSDNEFWVWYSLVALEGELSQQDICSLWSLSKQTVNTIITAMVKKGYAVLEVVPGTRNRKLIRLTEPGREYGEGLVLPVQEAEQRAFARLREEDQQAFSNALSHYIQNLKEEFYAK